MFRTAISAEHASKGQTIVTGTSEVTGSFSGILVIADTVISAMQWASQYPHSGDWSDLTSIPAGAYLPGRFISITPASGEFIAIHA